MIRYFTLLTPDMLERARAHPRSFFLSQWLSYAGVMALVQLTFDVLKPGLGIRPSSTQLAFCITWGALVAAWQLWIAKRGRVPKRATE
jgi:hypothetical protein